MNLPRKVRKGENFLVMHDLWNGLIDYLTSCRLVAGDRIKLQKYPSGTVISADRGTVAPANPSSGEASFQYSGPWGLYLEGSSIKVKPGLVWTPEGTSCSAPGPCSKPDEPSLIILSVEDFMSLTPVLSMSAIAGDLDQFYTPAPTNYWGSHVLLGRYDPAADTVTQYHFSPIVFLIETEDLIIAP